MEQAARPQPGACCVEIYGKLGILHEGPASFESARGYILVSARGVEVNEDPMAGQVGSLAAPITGQLCSLPEVAHDRARQAEYRSVVEKRQKARCHIC